MKTWMSLVVVCGVANVAACCSTSASSQGDAALDQAVTADVLDSGSPDNTASDSGSPDNGPDATADVGSDASDASDAGDVSDAADAVDGAIAPPMRCPACTGTGCTIVEVTTGSRFSCARRASGAVLCWGDNTLGELGDGTRIASSRPVEVLGVCDAVDIEAGAGTAWWWWTTCWRTWGGCGRCSRAGGT